VVRVFPFVRELMSILSMRMRKLRGILPRNGRVIAARLAGVALLASGAAVGANAWIDRIAAPHIYRDLDRVPDRFVAIVPGARVHSDGTPSAVLEDRLIAALEVYRAGKVRRILVSGDHAAAEYDEVNAMRGWLEDRGVPPGELFLDHAGLRTLDTMARAAAVFGVEDAVICTQEFHLPRAVFLARRAGIDAVGLVADRRIYTSRVMNGVREFAAKGVSFMDSYVFGVGPRHGGDSIPITGDGRVTRDDGSM
jgi:SanA protein